MFRLLTLLLAVLPALASMSGSASSSSLPAPADNGTVLRLDFPLPTRQPVPGGEQLRLPGEGLLGMAGCPDLPAVIRHIRVPSDRQVEMHVRAAQWLPVGQAQPAPVQERLHTEADLPLSWIQDESVYGADQLWPTEWLRLSEPMVMRGIRLVTMTIAPLRWNPATGELQRLAHLEVELSFQGHSDVNNPLWDDDEGLSDESEGVIYRFQAGENQFVRQLLGHRLLDPITGRNWGEDNSLDGISWETPELPLNYLVIIKNSLVSQVGFQTWLTWKRRKGHHVTVLTETQITNWNASSIKSAITGQYNGGMATRPHYVMLVGDPTSSAPFGLPTDGGQYDHYYACIEGDDVLGDVVVGRISVTSNAQLNTVFNKIVSYETSPYLDNPGWLQRASFLTGSGHCGESMSQLSRDIGFQLLLERGYTQIDTAFCANSPNYVYNWFEQGISHYTYRGWIGMEGLSTDQLLNLDQGPRTPVAVTFTCSSGEFYQDEGWGPAYTEAFLRAGTPSTPGGAVAAMGFCTSGTHTAYNNLVAGGFWSALLDYRIPQVGTCMFRGKLELFNTLPDNDGNITNFSNWANLMGDPGMEQWCGVPEVLHFDTLPETDTTAPHVLAARVLDADGDPVAGVAVCAYQGEATTFLGLTDSDGLVELNLFNLVEGQLYLTGSKAFHVPAQTRIPLAAAVAAPMIQSYTVVDDNQDGLLVPGESFTLQALISNASTSQSLPALSVEAVAVDTASVVAINNTTTLPALAPSGQATLAQPVVFTVSPSWAEGLPVKLDLRFSDGTRQYILRVDTVVNTPALGVRGTSWATSGGLYPGETKTLILRVHNLGNLTGHSLLVTPHLPEDSGLTITPDSQVLDSLAVGAVASISWSVTAATNLVPGYTVPVTFAWSDQQLSCGSEMTHAITLGNLALTDPTGPDTYGYYAFESTDTQWVQSPAYSWVEIAPNAGGTGTVLNLHDNSDEADDSRRVQLPFPFPVYGTTYSSMAVCSNGFVAFGPLAHLQTDFRNHFLPCGMGPEPMLAPMWDDLKLASDAQVVTKYMEAEHIFVVEWYKMRTNSNSAINTFQILLYDPAVYPTPTGDGEFVFQYNTFNDTQNNDQDFPYCTVGIKNQDATAGLTLLNYHERPATAAAFGAGKAVKFSTSIGMNLEPAQLLLSATEMTFLSPDSAVVALSDSLVLTNNGVAPLIWQATLVAPDNWPPSLGGDRDSGGPDAFGYKWMDSEEENGPVAGWAEVWESGTELVFADEDTTAAVIDLPFSFPFYGEAKTQLWVHTNGFASFQAITADTWQNNVTLPGTSAPDQSLLVYWDDLMLDDSYSGFVRYWTNDVDSVVVTWNQVPHHNATSYGGPFTFQLVLESNGRIAYNYGEMNEEDPDSDSGTIGWQVDSVTGFSIRQMQDTRDNLTIRILPPFWLTMGQNSGTVIAGSSQALVLHARNDLQGAVLPEGEYTATVQLHSNDPETPLLSLPVVLRVEADTELDPATPRVFTLGQAVPNPFNPVTHLALELPEAARVQARLFNVAGQQVATLVDGRFAAGRHDLLVEAGDLASGLYLLKVDAGAHHAVRKLTLLK